jgi:crotonobetainyl-CoA:carnitine CoA-transferase CaiB-like acyl-CoA transferase
MSNGGTLQGLRVLDFTRALAGPFCTQILADHGAEVVKIEEFVSGDMTRYSGPFHPSDKDRDQSGFFHSINRNKKSVVVDLKNPVGRELILKMAESFDVVVENFRAGVMDRLGLSFEALQARNPKLVYAAVRGFGDPRSGASPYVEWPAYDVVSQAMGGIIGVTGADAAHVTKVGPGVGDTIPGLYLTVGILAAVLRARETGKGQFVDVSMVDAVLAACERIVHQHSFGGIIAGPEGNHHPFIVPFGIFPATDGQVAIACPNDRFFAELSNRLDAPEMAKNPNFETIVARRTNRQETIDAVSAVTAKFSKAELSKRLGGHVPFGPVFNMAEIAEDPHFKARDMLMEIAPPGLSEKLRVAGVPIKFSDTPGGVYSAGPVHGAHTDEVLGKLGISTDQLKQWRTDGVIK